MKKLLTIAAMLVVVGTPSAEAKKPACKFEVDWRHPEKLNPEGGNAVMLGTCSKASDLPADLASTEFVGRSNWWAAFSCGYAAYRNGTQREANPYHQNVDLNNGWAGGWDQARWNCQHGRWGTADEVSGKE